MTEEHFDKLSKLKNSLDDVENQLNELDIVERVIRDLLANLISMVEYRMAIVGDEILKCPNCDYIATTEHSLTTHMGMKHGS